MKNVCIVLIKRINEVKMRVLDDNLSFFTSSISYKS